VADISDIQAAGTIKIVGSDNTGVEQTPVQTTSSGGLHTNIRDGAGNEVAGVNGSAVPTSVLQIGAGDGTNLQRLQARADVPSLNDLGLLVRTIPYRAPAFNISAITVPPALNKSMIALFNPGASAVVLKIQYLKIINNQTAAVTGVAVDFRMRRITGLVGGTAVVPQSFDTIDTLGPGILCSYTGTVSGESTTDLLRYVWSSDEWGPGAADVEAGDHAQQQMGYIFQNQIEAKTITLRPGQGITIKCLTNSTQGNFDFELCFTQEIP
jgi:hypothetical protein